MMVKNASVVDGFATADKLKARSLLGENARQIIKHLSTVLQPSTGRIL